MKPRGRRPKLRRGKLSKKRIEKIERQLAAEKRSCSRRKALGNFPALYTGATGY